ncbi:hypothetical protein A2865_02650 [Candidatus Woesebacteria bacterium RIFCSPHIGHO2_01_FULL_39_17]|uniref:Uncharacterized protein n=1 Tax=Candidatus Woesebacteria bacterium GW2011_GWA1_39_21b TaxID=1618551 RepID=A0A0G0NKP1_9BACT|nr:MAG: hypothetical protein UT40_C0018G0036 [Candidatus Woesebacteria bacterium GW2011_GWA1_39_21b]OGM22490.1 MAG: hypothetical protein A2865_02650 [Candidatus Woesebacteria bacterium RIFCSPHIGHO2_01_FULL_39_17]
MKSKTGRLSFYLLICWAIIGSVLVVILWRTNQRLERINALLLDTVTESNNLANNASEAYKIFGDCMTNQTTCKFQDVGAKLRQLNEDKEIINGRLSEIQVKLRKLK